MNVVDHQKNFVFVNKRRPIERHINNCLAEFFCEYLLLSVYLRTRNVLIDNPVIPHHWSSALSHTHTLESKDRVGPKSHEHIVCFLAKYRLKHSTIFSHIDQPWCKAPSLSACYTKSAFCTINKNTFHIEFSNHLLNAGFHGNWWQNFHFWVITDRI